MTDDRSGHFYSSYQFKKLFAGGERKRIKDTITLLNQYAERDEFAAMVVVTKELTELLNRAIIRWKDGQRPAEKKRKKIDIEPKIDWHKDVHSTHCCVTHRYCLRSDMFCPVVQGQQPQVTPCRCELRTIMGQEIFDAIEGDKK